MDRSADPDEQTPDQALPEEPSRAEEDAPTLPPAARTQNCSFYMRTGTCAYGDRCKFFHPQDRKAPLLNSKGYPLRPDQPNCSFYIRKGWCAFGVTCKWHHPQVLDGAPPDAVSPHQHQQHQHQPPQHQQLQQSPPRHMEERAGGGGGGSYAGRAPYPAPGSGVSYPPSGPASSVAVSTAMVAVPYAYYPGYYPYYPSPTGGMYALQPVQHISAVARPIAGSHHHQQQQHPAMPPVQSWPPAQRIQRTQRQQQPQSHHPPRQQQRQQQQAQKLGKRDSPPANDSPASDGRSDGSGDADGRGVVAEWSSQKSVRELEQDLEGLHLPEVRTSAA